MTELYPQPSRYSLTVVKLENTETVNTCLTFDKDGKWVKWQDFKELHESYDIAFDAMDRIRRQNSELKLELANSRRALSKYHQLEKIIQRLLITLGAAIFVIITGSLFIC